MNPFARLVLFLVIATLFAMGAVFAYNKMKEPVLQGPDLTKLGRVPVFELTSHTGEPFDSRILQGQVWVLDFFFTRCGGICPILTTRFEELAQVMEPYENWSLVSISVDPEFDTPEVLAQYRRERGITQENWYFLTGSEREVRTLIREGFLLPVEERPENTTEPILHSPRVILFDHQGNFRGFYDALDEDAVQGLKRDAASLAAQ